MANNTLLDLFDNKYIIKLQFFHQTNLTVRNDIGHVFSQLEGHVSDDGENGESGEEGGDGVDADDDEGIGEAVVLELVVRRQRDQSTPRRTQREEYLRGRLLPHLWKALF